LTGDLKIHSTGKQDLNHTLNDNSRFWKMMEVTHRLPCAAMQTGACLLRSGLEDVIKDYFKGNAVPTSDNIFCSCYVAVNSLWDKLIEESLVRQIDAFGVCESVNDLTTGTALNRCDGSHEKVSSRSFIDNSFEIRTGQNGRMLSSVTDDETERNTLILTDSPFLVTSVAPCGCKEGTNTNQMI
jgi:hypothetical protein